MTNIKTFFLMFKELIDILNKKQKKDGICLMLLLMVVSLLEMLGVGVIVPFIIAMLDPETLMKSQHIAPIIRKLHINEQWEFICIVALVIVFVYIFKNLFIIMVNFFQSNYRNNLEKDLNVTMLTAYMKHPYIYFVNTNSANIIGGVNNDMANVASVVDGYSTVFSEGLNAIAIGIFLIYLSPFIAISLLFIAGLTALMIILGLKKKVGQCGEQAREAFAEKYRDINCVIGGIKEITVAHKRDFFVNKFDTSAQKAAKNNTRYLWFSKLPSRMIEMIFILGLVVVVIISLGNTKSNLGFITQLGAVGVAAVRILPSISTLTNAMNSLIYLRPSLEEAYKNIKETEKKTVVVEQQDGEDYKFTDKLEIDGVSWRYKENLPWVLKDLSLQIRKGEAVGIVGSSGAGKTTLADVLLGLYTPQEGHILLDGRPIVEGRSWAKMIGYVPQTVYLVDDTIRNNIAFGVEEKWIDDKKIWEVLDRAQMSKTVHGLREGLDSMVGEKGIKLSGGQRQRIAIARALYHDPEIIVLDEATSALDNDTEQAIMEAIDALQGQKTLIIIAHRITTIRKCNRIYEIVDGKAYSRTFEEIAK